MPDAPLPPIAPRRPVVTTTHGHARTDEYGWLRDLDDPATTTHLEAENAYTEAMLAHLGDTREGLFDEFKGRIVETDLSVPVRRGPWWYYSRTEEGKSYPIHCRRPAGAPGEAPPSEAAAGDEQVILDENIEAGGADFFTVGILAVSPDHSMLAVGVDTRGDERLSLSFRPLDGGERPAEVIGDVSYGFAWAGDSTHALFTRVDAAWRPHQLWRHELGTDPSADVLVLEEPDARFNVSVGSTRDEAVIVVSISSSSTTEVRTLPADDPLAELTTIVPRVSGVENGLAHLTTRSGDAWWIRLTNDGALDFALVGAPDDGAVPSAWVELLAHRPGVRLEDVDVFIDALVVAERSDAETRLRAFDLGDGPFDPQALALDRSWLIGEAEGPTTTWLGANPEHDTARLRFGQTSMTLPSIVAEVALHDRSVTILKRQEVLGGYEPSQLVTYRLDAPGRDGELIPISVVHAVGLLVDPTDPTMGLRSPAPCLLYGYGSYEVSIDPTFSPFRLSLLERGAIFAIAHIRGGGEKGRRWYDDGHLAAKQHSFDDFLASADHLIALGHTSPDRLVARGGSAGGLLMGAVANQGPERFCGILAEVPFVDSLNTMLDPSLPLTVGEYEEWGNPTDDPAAYATIASWAPYENLRTTGEDGTPFTYPPMLLTGGLNDTRVGYWEPAKHVARLRHLNPENPVLLRMEMGVGHGGPSGRYDSWREEAFVMAWILERLGLTATA